MAVDAYPRMLTARECLLLNAYFSGYPGQFRASHSMDKHPGVSILIEIGSFYEDNPSCLTERKSSASKKWHQRRLPDFAGNLSPVDPFQAATSTCIPLSYANSTAGNRSVSLETMTMASASAFRVVSTTFIARATSMPFSDASNSSGLKRSGKWYFSGRLVTSTLGSLLQLAAYKSKNWDAVGWCWGTGLPRKTDTFVRVDDLVRRRASNSPSLTGCTMPEWGGADMPKNCLRASRLAFS